MRGYHGLAEATAETLDGGWLTTGDIGELDDDGFLTITDRKKDLIKTAGGKYVAPQPLEGKLKLLCPLIGQAIVHGDHRAYCTALVALDGEALRKWAARSGLTGSSRRARRPARGARDPRRRRVDELNAELPSYSTIKKFAVLPAELTTRGRRAHAQPQDQAPGHREEVQGAARRALPDNRLIAAAAPGLPGARL